MDPEMGFQTISSWGYEHQHQDQGHSDWLKAGLYYTTVYADPQNEDLNMNFKVYEGTKCDRTDMIYRLQYTCTCSLDICRPIFWAVSALF